MICLHCNKEVFSELLSTCPHCRKSLEGYTQRTTKETLNELERREAKGDGSGWLIGFLLVPVIVIGLVIIGLFVLAFMFGGSYGWGGAGAP